MVKWMQEIKNPTQIMLLFLVAIFIIAPVLTQAGEWKYLENSKIQWKEYNKTTFSEAKQTGKPLYVLVYADWCHWCKKFETETIETESIRTLLQEQMIPVAVNNDAQPEIGKDLRARLVPTSIILSPDGVLILRFYGFLAAAELKESLEATLTQWRLGELPEETFGDEATCCPIP